jgi:hypothetical protein
MLLYCGSYFIDLAQTYIGFSERLLVELTGAGRPSGLVVTRLWG